MLRGRITNYLNKSKGVICHIEEPENMPVDIDGVRADIVMDAGSIISRMNLGGLYEQFIGASAHKTSKRICEQLGVALGTKLTPKQMAQTDPALIEQIYQYLLGFYQITSPRQFAFFAALQQPERLEHLTDIVRDGIYVYYPTDNEVQITEVIRQLQQHYPPPYGPVTYVGNSGQRVTTENNVRIGPVYMMLLEKIADDWSSVSSGKLQHFGVLSPMTKSEKYAYPFRNSPVRTIGETEGRIFAAYCGREAIAEMMDRSNNPQTHRHVVWNVLNAQQPTNIEQAVDRNLVPLGSSKPLMMFNHIAMVSGFQAVYEEPEKL